MRPQAGSEEAALAVATLQRMKRTKTQTVPKDHGNNMSAIDLYAADHDRLRSEGISLADFVACELRDEFASYRMPSEMRARLDAIQAEKFGPVADPMRPLGR